MTEKVVNIQSKQRNLRGYFSKKYPRAGKPNNKTPWEFPGTDITIPLVVCGICFGAVMSTATYYYNRFFAGGVDGYNQITNGQIGIIGGAIFIPIAFLFFWFITRKNTKS